MLDETRDECGRSGELPQRAHATDRRWFNWLWFGCAVLTVAIAFPGHLGVDSLQQLEAALEHRFYAWHPPAMVAVWIVLNLAIKGPFLMLALQVFAWWLGLDLIARRVFEGTPARRSACLLAIGLFPPCFGHIIHVSKDAQMMSMLVLGVGVLFASEGRRANWPLWAGALAILYGSAVRYNGVAAAPPFVVWIALLLRDRPFANGSRLKQSWMSIAVTVALLGGPFALNAVLLPRNAGETPLTQTVYFDLVGISSLTNENLLPRPQGIVPRSEDEIDRLYASGWGRIFSDPRNRLALRGPNAARAREIWRSAVLASPLAYLDHRLHTFAIATGLSALDYGTIPRDWRRIDISFPEHGLEVHWERTPFSMFARSWLGFTVERFSGLFRSWRYLGLAGLALLGFAIFALRGHPVPIRTALLLSSAWLYSGTYLFVGGQPEMRFHLWSVAAVLLAAVFLLYEIRDSRRVPIGRAGRAADFGGDLPHTAL